MQQSYEVRVNSSEFHDFATLFVAEAAKTARVVAVPLTDNVGLPGFFTRLLQPQKALKAEIDFLRASIETLAMVVSTAYPLFDAWCDKPNAAKACFDSLMSIHIAEFVIETKTLQENHRVTNCDFDGVERFEYDDLGTYMTRVCIHRIHEYADYRKIDFEYYERTGSRKSQSRCMAEYSRNTVYKSGRGHLYALISSTWDRIDQSNGTGILQTLKMMAAHHSVNGLF